MNTAVLIRCSCRGQRTQPLLVLSRVGHVPLGSKRLPHGPSEERNGRDPHLIRSVGLLLTKNVSARQLGPAFTTITIDSIPSTPSRSATPSNNDAKGQPYVRGYLSPVFYAFGTPGVSGIVPDRLGAIHALQESAEQQLCGVLKPRSSNSTETSYAVV